MSLHQLATDHHAMRDSCSVSSTMEELWLTLRESSVAMTAASLLSAP